MNPPNKDMITLRIRLVPSLTEIGTVSMPRRRWLATPGYVQQSLAVLASLVLREPQISMLRLRPDTYISLEVK